MVLRKWCWDNGVEKMALLRVEVEPKLLDWAMERSGVSSDDLHRRFNNLDFWLMWLLAWMMLS